MKRNIILTLLLLAAAIAGQAQRHPGKFSPEKFEAEMETYITREASLTQQEATDFFPLFREMHEKQRALFRQMKHGRKDRPGDDKACAEAIAKNDKLNIELKQIEQKYHQKFLKLLPATKVYDIIQAENRYHRQVMKGWQKKPKDTRH